MTAIHEAIYARVTQLVSNDTVSGGLRYQSDAVSAPYLRGGFFRAYDDRVENTGRPFMVADIADTAQRRVLGGSTTQKGVMIATVRFNVHVRKDTVHVSSNPTVERLRRIMDEAPAYEPTGAEWRVSSFIRKGGGLSETGADKTVYHEDYQCIVTPGKAGPAVFEMPGEGGWLQMYGPGGIRKLARERRWMIVGLSDPEDVTEVTTRLGVAVGVPDAGGVICRSLSKAQQYNSSDAEYVAKFAPVFASFPEFSRGADGTTTGEKMLIPCRKRAIIELGSASALGWIDASVPYLRPMEFKTIPKYPIVVNTDTIALFDRANLGKLYHFGPPGDNLWWVYRGTSFQTHKSGYMSLLSRFWTSGAIEGVPVGPYTDIAVPPCPALYQYQVQEASPYTDPVITVVPMDGVLAVEGEPIPWLP